MGCFRFRLSGVVLVILGSFLTISGATDVGCQNQNEANRKIGTIESHVDILENTISSLKDKLAELSQRCQDVQPCQTVEKAGCPPCTESLLLDCPPGSNCAGPSQHKPIEITYPEDCAGYLERGRNTSGIYRIQPKHYSVDGPFDVYCDMDTDGGGWTVFQRRNDYGEPRQNFYLDWENYKKGFGNLSQEFWLGNDKLFALTNQKKTALRIDLEDFEGERRYAKYEEFVVYSERAKYTATFWDFSGTVGDSLSGQSNNTAFSTKDQDNDRTQGRCTSLYKGGWWYGKCHGANLNGLYLKGAHDSYGDGVNWKSWKGYHYSLKLSEMKIRPSSFRITA